MEEACELLRFALCAAAHRGGAIEALFTLDYGMQHLKTASPRTGMYI
jgi:hypothetical protein